MAETDAILAEHPTLGPYTLTRKLGEGGMGGVYLGKHNVLQVEHAIKIIRPRMAADPQLVERFLREARHAARLIHPNIVQVLAADVADGLYYLAMQFVQGQSLADAVAKGKLPPHRAVRYIHMACLGLHYAHRKQIIHRDIKPGNLLIDEEDSIKITDFGLVRDMAADDTGQNNLTQTGLIIGTPHFMPPEQWHGEGVDLRSDIYAMGVTLFHLMTRSYPYPGRTPPQILGLLMQGKPEPLKKFVPNVDDDLQQIVSKAMATDMDKRYQTCAEFAADLDKWWAAHPPTEADSIALATAGAESSGTKLGSGTRLGTPTQLAASGSLGANVSSRAGITPVTGAGATAMSVGPPSGQAPQTPTQASNPPTPGVSQSGQVLTPMAPQVTIIQQGSKSGLVIGLTLVALIALALGAYAVFGLGNKNNGNTGTAGDGNGKPPAQTPTFSLKLSANEATSENPLYTDIANYVIDGDANVPVMLNGRPYKLGEAYALKAGPNKLEISAEVGSEKIGRTLYITLDTEPPELAIALFDKAIKGEYPTEATSLKIAGTAKDIDEKTTVSASVNGVPVADINVGKAGEFEIPLKVDDAELTVQVRAQDRQGHKSKMLQVVIVPDRKPATILWDQKVVNGAIWSITKEVTLSGKFDKPKGRTLFIGNEAVKIVDGKFSVTRALNEGVNTVTFKLTDWLDRTSNPEAKVIVDLYAPRFIKLKPASGEVFSQETLPYDIVITGETDDPEASLSINGEIVKPDTKGVFTYTLKATEAKKYSIKLLAIDMAERRTEQTLEYTVKLLRYRLLPKKNAQGYAEYERVRDGMVFVAIPAGKFKQGVKDGLPDAPAREVTMGAYLIAKYETTNKQFVDFLNSNPGLNDTTVFTRDILSKDPSGANWNLKYDGSRWSATGFETLPVVGVTWNGARAYCLWADEASDLPSEAQWEYAARGNDERTYPWGKETPSIARCNFAEGGLGGLAKVGTLKDGASMFGVMDAAGNVEEWCLDWYDVVSYTKMMMDNPVVSEKPQGGERRVVRGGSYLSSATSTNKPTSEDAHSDLRAYQRGRALPQSGANDRGFRAAAKMPE